MSESSSQASSNSWKKCSACKEPIGFGQSYYVCSVSTCNRARTALQFCSDSCWEVHLPIARHREAWAEERTAPREAEAASEGVGGERKPRRILARPPAGSGGSPASSGGRVPQEVLIVASRLKEYVRAISGMSTSDRVLDPLSDIVREVVEEAVRHARAEGRKTLLERDVPKR